MNVFKIKELEFDLIRDGHIIAFHANISANVEIICDKHMNRLGRLKIKAESSSGLNKNDVIKNVIQKMLNHEYDIDREIYKPVCDCDPIFNKIHFDFSNLEDPWRQMFENLFKDSNWSIIKMINNHPEI